MIMYFYPSFFHYSLGNGLNSVTKINKIINSKQEKTLSFFTHK
ncbi:hypothetical protein M089_1346 [Bacteroides ovatus str. 3725 D9 iii]|nr:hypothetical protein M088_2704 [Bacteroides ovatus str. 3725 D1 iv]KDS19422.1 hypothetical protein M082_3159 [Bacteroides fragilis str. 3725 D9 ii]KDS44557.1 hypothetical protein M089_1346 [Bacteroides ovatus str. 3725 D9 iii]